MERKTGNRSTAVRKKFTAKPMAAAKRRNPTGRKVSQSVRRVAEASPIDEKSDSVRIIPLGGVEEVGKNMTLIEYKGHIVIVDMGFQFTDEETPGVDYIIPDTSYLEARKKRISGVVITHGHLDHIGGIPYMIDKIGNPKIYTRNLTALMIKKRHEEFPHLPELNLEIVETNSKIQICEGFSMRFFKVTHTIPDSMGVIFETPMGNAIFTGDLKVDHNDDGPTDEEIKEFGELGKQNNLVLLADSTNADVAGWSHSEKYVHSNIEDLIRNTKGRLIIGTFASLLERLMFIIDICAKTGKKVVVDGRSMKTNIEIAKMAEMLNPPKDLMISVDEIDNYPQDKIVILATGAQGDRYASLMRMSKGSHKKIKLTKHDTIILSSSIVPGNEKSVQRLKDGLARHGARILHYKTLDIHASGHANHDELKWIQEQIKPKFFIPIHGYHHFLQVHKTIAMEAGMSEDNVVIPDNGTIIEFYDGGTKVRKLKDSASSRVVMIDATSDDLSDIVVRDRKQLSEDGIFVVIVTTDAKTGAVIKSPDIISRGFIYLKESRDLLQEARKMSRKAVEDVTKGAHPINYDYAKNSLRDSIERLLSRKTGKRPIVLPVILEV